MRLSDAKLTLDGATATGTIGVEEREAQRPHVVADLKVSGLNLDNYVGAGAELGATAARRAPRRRRCRA